MQKASALLRGVSLGVVVSILTSPLVEVRAEPLGRVRGCATALGSIVSRSAASVRRILTRKPQKKFDRLSPIEELLAVSDRGERKQLFLSALRVDGVANRRLFRDMKSVIAASPELDVALSTSSIRDYLAESPSATLQDYFLVLCGEKLRDDLLSANERERSRAVRLTRGIVSYAATKTKGFARRTAGYIWVYGVVFAIACALVDPVIIPVVAKVSPRSFKAWSWVTNGWISSDPLERIAESRKVIEDLDHQRSRFRAGLISDDHVRDELSEFKRRWIRIWADYHTQLDETHRTGFYQEVWSFDALSNLMHFVQDQYNTIEILETELLNPRLNPAERAMREKIIERNRQGMAANLAMVDFYRIAFTPVAGQGVLDRYIGELGYADVVNRAGTARVLEAYIRIFSSAIQGDEYRIPQNFMVAESRRR